MLNTYQGKVVEILEDGSAVVTIPEELIEELGWFEGDLLEFEVLEDGSLLVINCNKQFRDAVKRDYENER